MLAWLSSKLRERLNGPSRRVFRRVADVFLSPIGSINGALRPTNSVAITFDDGPDGEVTPRLLDLLRGRGVRATFFVLTDKIAAEPALAKRLVDEGHEVGLHFDRHDRLTQLPVAEVRERMDEALSGLRAWAGPVRFFRPPFGAQSLATYRAARARGLEIVAWGPFAEDWLEQTPAAAADKALNGMKGGDVLLLHDGLEIDDDERPTFDRVRMVELLLDGMAARGLTPTTVGAMVDADGSRRSAWFRL